MQNTTFKRERERKEKSALKETNIFLWTIFQGSPPSKTSKMGGRGNFCFFFWINLKKRIPNDPRKYSERILQQDFFNRIPSTGFTSGSDESSMNQKRKSFRNLKRISSNHSWRISTQKESRPEQHQNIRTKTAEKYPWRMLTSSWKDI